MKKIVIFILSISAFSQDYGNNAETLELCTTLQSNSFSSDLDADNALDRILSVVGLSKNFVLSPCSDINNAVAVSYKGVRYILYDPEFMSMLSSNTSNWTNLFILAHEVGHHVNGHSLDLVLYAGDIVDAPELEKKRQQELEADEFAGFVLAKLGATLSQTTSSVSRLSNEDDKYSTHPKRDKRVVSIKNGWNSGYVIKDRVVKKDDVINKERIVITTKEKKFQKWFFKVDYPKQKKIQEIKNETKDVTNPLQRQKLLNDINKIDYPEKIKTAWSFGLITENNSNVFNNKTFKIRTGIYRPLRNKLCNGVYNLNYLDYSSLKEINLKISQKYYSPKTPKLEFTNGALFLSNFSDLDYWWYDIHSPLNNFNNHNTHTVYFQYIIDDFLGMFELKIDANSDLYKVSRENGRRVLVFKREALQNQKFIVAMAKGARRDIDFGLNYHSKSEFIEKLKSGKILKLKLLGVSISEKGIHGETCKTEFYSFYDISNTYEFDLKGSSKALSF